jgi:hypothetical protein
MPSNLGLKMEMLRSRKTVYILQHAYVAALNIIALDFHTNTSMLEVMKMH